VAQELAVAQAVEGSGAEPSRWAELWVIRPGKSPTPPLIKSLPNEIIDQVAWSPDGSRIAYRGRIMQSSVVDGVTRSEPVETFVRVIESGSTGVTPVEIDALRDSDFTTGAGPAWSPDGSQLAWVLGGELRVGAPDGSGWRALPPVSSDELGMGWATDPVIWSADGSQLLVGQLSAPKLGQGVETSVVLYDVDSNDQPALVLPWREGGYGRLSWQVLHE
jgi:Tol biopolymer transport system component